MANVSDRTAHVKLTDRQWARLDREEKREVERRARKGDDTPIKGFKAWRIRQLVSRGLLLERLQRAERREARKVPGGRVVNCGACGLERGPDHVDGWTYTTDDVSDGNADYALCPTHARDCTHPDDDRSPLSGDNWICTLCQTYVNPPGQVTG